MTTFARWKGIVEITKMGDYTIKMEAATGALLRLDSHTCSAVFQCFALVHLVRIFCLKAE